MRVTSCRNVLQPEQIEAVPEQIKALESRFASCSVLANLPTVFGKILIYPVFCVAKLSASNPTASVLVISPLNSIIKVSECKFTELGLSAVHVKDWTGLSLETGHSPKTFCCYRQTFHCSWLVSYVNYIM